MVEVVRDTRFVNIGFRSMDPEARPRGGQRPRRGLRSLESRVPIEDNRQWSEWLSEQVDEQRKLVQASEAALQRYREEHGADALGDRQNIVVQRLGELQAAATAAAAVAIEKEALYKQLLAVQIAKRGGSTRCPPSPRTRTSRGSRVSWRRCRTSSRKRRRNSATCTPRSSG
jgi:uncharacterized protein involved in exopolysaccharide biosynthesis